MKTKRCSHCRKILNLENFYRRKDRKNGYSSWCNKCKQVAIKQWRDKNPEYLKQYNHKKYYLDVEFSRQRVRESYHKIRQTIYAHYGNKCVCCGETNPGFLTLDHVESNGGAHRKHIGRNIEKWIIDNNYPNSIQLLCWNCNMGRSKTKEKICPHKL